MIEGTSNAMIHGNIAYKVVGHSFFVGSQSERNVFEKNLGEMIIHLLLTDTSLPHEAIGFSFC